MGNLITHLLGRKRARRTHTPNSSSHADTAPSPESAQSGILNDSTQEYGGDSSLKRILDTLPSRSVDELEVVSSEPISIKSRRLSLAQVSSLQGPDCHTDLSTQPLYLRLDWHNGRKWNLGVSEGMASGPFFTTDSSGDERICFTGPAHIFLALIQLVKDPICLVNKCVPDGKKIICNVDEFTDVVNKCVRNGVIRLRLENAKSYCFKVGTIRALFQPSGGVDWFIADLEGKFLSDFDTDQLNWMSTFRCADGKYYPIKGIARQSLVSILPQVYDLKLISVCDLDMELCTPADCKIDRFEYKAEHVLRLKVVRGKPLPSMSGSPVAILHDDQGCTLLGQITGLVHPTCEEDCHAVKYVLVLPFDQMQQVMFKEFESSFAKWNLEMPNFKPMPKIYGESTYPTFSTSGTYSSGFNSKSNMSRSYSL